MHRKKIKSKVRKELEGKSSQFLVEFIDLMNSAVMDYYNPMTSANPVSLRDTAKEVLSERRARWKIEQCPLCGARTKATHQINVIANHEKCTKCHWSTET